MKGFFITGTDTEVGKSWFSAALVRHLRQQGHQAIGLKPLASGSDSTPEGLRNEDALLLQQAADNVLSYDQVNPLTFEPAIAPHLAARQAGQVIDCDQLVAHCQQMAQQYPLQVVEGAGGWLVPLNEHKTYADVAVALGLPVIVVVGLRLGCLNHALLTLQVIQHSGLPVAGWVANALSADMPWMAENIATLQHWTEVPCVAQIPYQGGADGHSLDVQWHTDVLMQWL